MKKSSQVLVFDPFSGASGDMITGSLLDLGADESVVKTAMESTADVTVTITRTRKGLIRAARVEVVQSSDTRYTYSQMVDHIRAAGLPDAITTDILGIIELMGRSEAEVHGTSLDELHLHEMGQQDAIADIVGTVVAFHDLGLPGSRIYCLPVSVGGGYVDTSHGKLPVPAPATLQILNSSNLIWRGGPVEHELLTPTGAAVLAYYTGRYGSCTSTYPRMVSSRTGHGAGSKELGIPNVLRTVLGEPDADLDIDHIEMLETNVDDVTGEVLGYLIQELMDDGALDVSIIPATMKKGRSGALIKVICNTPDTHRLARRIMAETGSLGVRSIPVRHRFTARRKTFEVEIPEVGRSYHIRIKAACNNRGEIFNISAEFEDCRKMARETGLPLKDIILRAQEAARSQMNSE